MSKPRFRRPTHTPLSFGGTESGRLQITEVKIRALLREVCSEGEPDGNHLVVAAGAAGPDVSGTFLLSRFTKAYMIDETPVSENRLEDWRKQWPRLDPEDSHFRKKYNEGFSVYGNFTDLERSIIMELKAMGVSRTTSRSGR